jgi:hypothetical protein
VHYDEQITSTQVEEKEREEEKAVGHGRGWSTNEDHFLLARVTTLETSLGLSRMLFGEKK